MNKVKASLVMLGITALAAALMLIPKAAAEEQAVPVEICRVERGSVEQVLALTGTLRYEVEYAALSPAAGVVAQVYVEPGQTVREGQALFRLRDDAQAAAVTAALANQGAVDEALPVSLPALGVQEASAAMAGLTVRAAADGTVQQVNVSPYGGVMAGHAAVTLSGGAQIVRCSAVLRDAEKLRAGMRARILREDETVAEAVVKEIGPAQVSSATGQTVCPIMLAMEQPMDLPLGAVLDVEVILCGRDDVPVLPITAVTASGTVWWVAEGRCYETPVESILEDEVNCWVNLPEGTCVVMKGEVAHGQRVKEAGE